MSLQPGTQTIFALSSPSTHALEEAVKEPMISSDDWKENEPREEHRRKSRQRRESVALVGQQTKGFMLRRWKWLAIASLATALVYVQGWIVAEKDEADGLTLQLVHCALFHDSSSASSLLRNQFGWRASPLHRQRQRHHLLQPCSILFPFRPSCIKYVVRSPSLPSPPSQPASHELETELTRSRTNPSSNSRRINLLHPSLILFVSRRAPSFRNG